MFIGASEMSLEARPVYRMLRLRQVSDVTGLPPASIYALMARDEFPRQVALSINRVAWVEADVQAWVRARVDNAEQSDNPRGCRPPKAARRDARPARVQRSKNSTRADGRRKATRN